MTIEIERIKEELRRRRFTGRLDIEIVFNQGGEIDTKYWTRKELKVEPIKLN